MDKNIQKLLTTLRGSIQSLKPPDGAIDPAGQIPERSVLRRWGKESFWGTELSRAAKGRTRIHPLHPRGCFCLPRTSPTLRLLLPTCPSPRKTLPRATLVPRESRPGPLLVPGSGSGSAWQGTVCSTLSQTPRALARVAGRGTLPWQWAWRGCFLRSACLSARQREPKQTILFLQKNTNK